jgi:hypothetical protein
VLAFQSCDKTPEKITLRKIYFGSLFQKFRVMVTWLHCFWTCGEAEHHGRSTWWGKVAHLMAAGKQREGGLRYCVPAKAHLQ